MKKIAKYLLYLLGLLITIIIGWLAFNMFDEDLEAGFNDFFYEDRVDNKENGFIALAGISAPEGIDTFAYGEKVLAESQENAIQFAGKANFDCWVVQHKKQPAKNNVSCADKETLIQSIKSNALLLDRYDALRNYKHFIDNFAGWENGQLLIQLNELFLAKLAVLISEGESEEALRAWLKDTRYWQMVIADKQGLVGKSIVMVIYNRNLQFLPVIISSNPSLAEQYKSELLTTLNVQAFGQGGWDIAATMRAEYEVIKMLDRNTDQSQSLRGKVFYKANATRNSFYYFAKDMVWLSQQPPEDFQKAKQRIDKKYIPRPIWQQMIYNPIGNLVLGGMFVGSDLLSARHYHAVYSRMLSLYIEAKSENIAFDDMQNFINKSEKKFRNPITGEPFTWDVQSKSIYFVVPNSDGTRREIFY